MERSEGALCVVQSKKRESTMMTPVQNETEEGITTKNESDVMKNPSETRPSRAHASAAILSLLLVAHPLNLVASYRSTITTR